MNLNSIQTGRPNLTLLLLTASLAVGPALAGTMTITLDDVTVDACREVWSEIGVPLRFTETIQDDPDPGLCVFDPDANDYGLEGVYLGPARLIVNVSRVEGLGMVYVDVYINLGRASAQMLRDGEHVYYHAISDPGHQTLGVPCEGGDTVTIFAQDAYVWEIRLTGQDLVPAESISFGCLKTTYGP